MDDPFFLVGIVIAFVLFVSPFLCGPDRGPASDGHPAE